MLCSQNITFLLQGLKPFHQTIFWSQKTEPDIFLEHLQLFLEKVTTVCWIVWAPGCKAFTIAVAIEIIVCSTLLSSIFCFLRTGATPAINGICGGSCLLSWIPFCIIWAHKRYWGSVYSSPSWMYFISSTSLSSSTSFSQYLSFFWLFPSSARPSHHKRTSLFLTDASYVYIVYILSKSSWEHIHTFIDWRPSKYPTLKSVVVGNWAPNWSNNLTFRSVTDENLSEKWCNSLVRASLFLLGGIILTLHKYFTYI